MKQREFGFEVVGTMPLLMHRDDVEAADAVQEDRNKPEHKRSYKKGDDRFPAWTWQSYLYSDGEHLAVPSDTLMAALRQAAAQITLSRTTSFKGLSQSGMMVQSEFCPLYVGDKQIEVGKILAMRDKPFATQAAAVQKLGFQLFTKRARVGTAKHVRVRPRFDRWRLTGRMLVWADEISQEVLSEMLRLAGRVGIGDWRPSCKSPGPFGTFTAKLMK